MARSLTPQNYSESDIRHSLLSSKLNILICSRNGRQYDADHGKRIKPRRHRANKSSKQLNAYASIVKHNRPHEFTVRFECSTAFRPMVFGSDCKGDLRSKSHPKRSTRQMENQSPAIPKSSALLIEAVTKPGLIMKAYRA